MLCAAPLIVLAVACGSSTKSSSASTTPGSSTYPAGKQQVCQARDQLNSSLSALTNPILLTQGTSNIKAAIDKVQSNLTTLSKAAQQDYKPQVDAMQSSLTQLRTAVGNVGTSNAAQSLPAVGSAIANVRQSSNDLFSKLKTACGS